MCKLYFPPMHPERIKQQQSFVIGRKGSTVLLTIFRLFSLFSSVSQAQIKEKRENKEWDALALACVVNAYTKILN